MMFHFANKHEVRKILRMCLPYASDEIKHHLINSIHSLDSDELWQSALNADQAYVAYMNSNKSNKYDYDIADYLHLCANELADLAYKNHDKYINLNKLDDEQVSKLQAIFDMDDAV